MDEKFKSLNTVDDLSILNGHAFEEYLTQLFSDLGYAAEKTPGSGDFGADVILRSPDCKIAVQAKQYAGDVGFDAVKEIHFAKSFYDADEAWVVCTHGYTAQAIEAASAAGVRLIDGVELERLISRVQRGESEVARDWASGLGKAMERVYGSASCIPLLIEYVYALEWELCSPVQKADADGRLSFSEEQALSLPNERFDEAVRLGLVVRVGEAEGERRYSLNLDEGEWLAMQDSFAANVKLYNDVVEALKNRRDDEGQRLENEPVGLLLDEVLTRWWEDASPIGERLLADEEGRLQEIDRRLLSVVSAMEHARADGDDGPFNSKWIMDKVKGIHTPQAAVATAFRAREKRVIYEIGEYEYALSPFYKRRLEELLNPCVQKMRFFRLRGEGIQLLEKAALSTEGMSHGYLERAHRVRQLKADLENLRRSLGSLPENGREREALEGREEGLVSELEECGMFSVFKKNELKRQIEETRRELEELRQAQEERATVLRSIERNERELKSIEQNIDRSKLVNVFDQMLAAVDEACRLDGVFALKECCQWLKIDTGGLGEEPPIALQ